MMPRLLATAVLSVLTLAAVARPAAADDTPWSRSYALEAKGEYAAAARELKAVIAGRQPDEFAWLRYGWLTYLAKDYNTALSAYRQAESLNPSSIEAKLGATLPLMAQEKWAESSAALEQVLRADPWDYTAHVRLLYIESLQEHWATLERHAAQVAARYPSDVTVLLYLGYAQDQLNHVDDARVTYAKVLKRYPGQAQAVAFFARH